jgi:hypothetical protein
MPTIVPVYALIPTVREVTAVSTSALDQLTAIKTAMETPGERWQLGEFVLNGDDKVVALLLEYGGMQLCLRAPSSTELLCSLHPEGGIDSSNILSPSTDSGSPERSISSYIDGTNLLGLTDGRIQIGEFEAAVTIFFRQTDNRWVAGLHAGEIYYGDNLNDADNGFDGMGLLIGRPGVYTTNASTSVDYIRSMWLTQQFSGVELEKIAGSVVRVPGNLWVTPVAYNAATIFTADTNLTTAKPNDVDGKPRLQPIKIAIRGATSSKRVGPIIGALRFLRTTNNPPTEIADSDQFWSSNNVKSTSASTSAATSYEVRNLVFAWNKNYLS